MPVGVTITGTDVTMVPMAGTGGVRSELDHLAGELVAHEDVAGQVRRRSAEVRSTLHPRPQLEHRRPVDDEVQVGSADPARLDVDEHLAGAGSRLGNVVADVHPAVAQDRRTHQRTVSASRPLVVIAPPLPPGCGNDRCQISTIGYGESPCQLPLISLVGADGPASPPTTGGPSGVASSSTPASSCSGPRAPPAPRCAPSASTPASTRATSTRASATSTSWSWPCTSGSSTSCVTRSPWPWMAPRRICLRQMRAAVGAAVGFVDDDRRRARVLYVEALGNEALNRRRIRAGYDITAFIETDAVARRGPAADGERIGALTATLLVGGISEVLVAWLDGRLDVSRQDLIDDTTELFLGLTETAARVAARRRRPTSQSASVRRS